MSMHISAAPGEVAENVILPGDPLRARYIAEKYLEGAVRVNEIRNTWGYTARTRASAYPSCPPAWARLHAHIRHGALPGVRLQKAHTLRHGGGHAGAHPPRGHHPLPGRFHHLGHQRLRPARPLRPIADFGLLDRAYHLAAERGCPVYVGNTLTNDHLYVENKLEYSKLWAKYGILASEQEGVALYTAAALYGARALMMLSIVVNLYRPEESVSDAVKESGLDSIIQLALDTVID